MRSKYPILNRLDEENQGMSKKNRFIFHEFFDFRELNSEQYLIRAWTYQLHYAVKHKDIQGHVQVDLVECNFTGVWGIHGV